METPNKTYAFIDVPNIQSTARQALGFSIDWFKLYDYLKTRWKCEKIFYYSDHRSADVERIQEHHALKELGYVVFSKPYRRYVGVEEEIQIHCTTCNQILTYIRPGKVTWKSNCDVEIAVDCMNLVQPDSTVILFSGDGDFEYVIRQLVAKGVRVYIVSSPDKILKNNLPRSSRLSSKLLKLISEFRSQVSLINLKDLQKRIEKV